MAEAAALVAHDETDSSEAASLSAPISAAASAASPAAAPKSRRAKAPATATPAQAICSTPGKNLGGRPQVKQSASVKSVYLENSVWDLAALWSSAGGAGNRSVGTEIAYLLQDTLGATYLPPLDAGDRGTVLDYVFLRTLGNGSTVKVAFGKDIAAWPATLEGALMAGSNGYLASLRRVIVSSGLPESTYDDQVATWDRIKAVVVALSDAEKISFVLWGVRALLSDDFRAHALRPSVAPVLAAAPVVGQAVGPVARRAKGAAKGTADAQA